MLAQGLLCYKSEASTKYQSPPAPTHSLLVSLCSLLDTATTCTEPLDGEITKRATSGQHMARQRQEMLPDNLRELPPDEVAAVAPGRGGAGGGILDAGRVLMLWGWWTIAVTVPSMWNRPPDEDDAGAAAADATHAFLGLLLWLAGVSLVTFTPAARRRRRQFPRVVAPRGGGAGAVTSVVISCFFPPWN